MSTSKFGQRAPIFWILSTFVYTGLWLAWRSGNETFIVSSGLYLAGATVVLVNIALGHTLSILITRNRLWTVYLVLLSVAAILFYVEGVSDLNDPAPFFPTRLIIASLIIGVLIHLARGDIKRLTTTDLVVVSFAGISLGFITLASKNGIFLDAHMGKHWIILAQSLGVGSSSMNPVPVLNLASLGGSEAFFTDAALYKNQFYMAYGHGSVIFPILFGNAMKLFTIGLGSCGIYLYSRIYVNNAKDNRHLWLVPSLIALCFAPLIVMSGTYYPYPIAGAALAVGFTLLVNDIFPSDNRRLSTYAVISLLGVIASLFRIEAVIVLIAILFVEFVRWAKRPRGSANLWSFGLLAAGVVLAVTLAAFQNFLKFDDPLQSGIGWNHMIADPSFAPVSLNYLDRNLRAFFLTLPRIDGISAAGSFGPLRLPFTGFIGSEPGGYLLVTFPMLGIGVVAVVARHLRNRIGSKSNRSDFGKFEISVAFFYGLALLSFYLLSFHTSPKFQMLIVLPLLAGGLSFIPRSRVIACCFLAWSVFFQALALSQLANTYGYVR